MPVSQWEPAEPEEFVSAGAKAYRSVIVRGSEFVSCRHAHTAQEEARGCAAAMAAEWNNPPSAGDTRFTRKEAEALVRHFLSSRS